MSECSPPVLFTLDEVAERLHVSRRWLQGFLRGRPFGRIAGRKRLFTENDLADIIEALPRPSIAPRPLRLARRAAPSATRDSEATMARARELLSKPARARPQRTGAALDGVGDKPRKDAYEALHPETKHESFKGNQHACRQLGDNQIAGRFTTDTAAKTGQSERAVQRDAILQWIEAAHDLGHAVPPPSGRLALAG